MEHVNVLDDPLRPDAEPAEATSQALRPRTGRCPHASPSAEPQVESVEWGGLRWINIERPGPAERAWLEEHFEFHPLDYEDVLSRNQRPKIDEYDDYLFIVLYFPVFDKTVGRLNAAELDIFIGPDFLITIPNRRSRRWSTCSSAAAPPRRCARACFSKGSGYLLYKIVDDSFDYCFPMLRKIGNKLERIEEEIFEGKAEEVVRDLSNSKQEIINFRKIIRPQRAVLRDLERTKQRYLADDMEIYFDDIVDASERIWDMLENYKEVVEALEDTNESVISHRVNEVLRVLTAFSVMILPLTLLASLFGMNVEFPFEARRRGVLGHHRRDGRRAGRDGRLLPPARLPVEPVAVVDPSIFKAYDVRGTYPDQMDEQLAYRIGRAFARVLAELQDKPVEELRVALGRDMRLSAPSMAAGYARGIADEGVDVLDIGMVGTEQLYWTVGSRELDGGLMCTASHNPQAYTGAKLVKRGALALSGDSGIGELREIVTAGRAGTAGGAAGRRSRPRTWATPSARTRSSSSTRRGSRR